MQRHHETSDQLCRYVADATGDCVVLSFSRGKDALGTWIQLERYFRRIVPFFLYIVPGLQFVEDSLRYYEDFFHTPILRLPQPSLLQQLRNCVWQPPDRVEAIEALNIQVPSRDDLARICAQEAGLKEGTYVALGNRATDNLVRRTALLKWGSLNPKRRTFWPIYDWSKQHLRDELKARGVRLPVDYAMFGCSFDGLRYSYLEPIRQRFPADYQRILDWFPLAETAILVHQKEEARNGKEHGI